MLPIIDLQKFRSGDPETRRAIASTISDGCQSIGFIYMVNHGIPNTTIDAAKSAMRQFFALSDAEKRKIERPSGRYRGYIPMSHFSEDSQGQVLVLYESFLQGMPIEDDDPRIAATDGLLAPNVWPQGAGAVVRQAAQDYWTAVDAVSNDLLRAFALALKLPENEFVRNFADQLTNISYLHYPARPKRDNEADAPPPKAHYDTNALTILLPDPVGGLEVQLVDGSWTEVEPLEGAFIVNIGNMMEAWSGGRFKSTMHRVNPPPGVERYSIGFFAVPNYETVIEPVSSLEIKPAPSANSSLKLHVGAELEKFVASCDATQRL
ncbi:MAG: isopenicillin N synthase family oxygenase [Alphaproteobacteria bacterium]|nr:isopenicillin N synthase family oxygenase [Alphaproteobacteria bacterium]